MKTLYATDLDGTLLDPTAHLSATSARMFDELVSAGALITIVTARTPATVEPLLKAIHPRVPEVVMTGAAWWNHAEQRYERVHYHRPEDVDTITELCQRAGVTPFAYTMPPGSNRLKVYHAAPMLSRLEHSFVTERTISDLKSFSLHSHRPVNAKEHTVLFFAMGEPQRIKAAAMSIKERTDCYASWYPDTYNPGVALLEVFAPGVSKAAGLMALKESLGVDRVVAFGDNLNDIPMLQAADVAVCVENAHPKVKAVSHIVLGHNSTDPVVRFIASEMG